jgi:hypothetical protein
MNTWVELCRLGSCTSCVCLFLLSHSIDLAERSSCLSLTLFPFHLRSCQRIDQAPAADSFIVVWISLAFHQYDTAHPLNRLIGENWENQPLQRGIEESAVIHHNSDMLAGLCVYQVKGTRLNKCICIYSISVVSLATKAI